MHLQGKVLAGRDPVVERPKIAYAARTVEDDVLHQRVAEAHHGRDLVLHCDMLRVQCPADIGHGDVTDEKDLPGFRIDLDLGCGARKLKEMRRTAEWMVWRVFAAYRAKTDHLSFHVFETRPQHVTNRLRPTGQLHHASLDSHTSGTRAVQLCRHFAQLRVDVRAGPSDSLAHEHGGPAG